MTPSRNINPNFALPLSPTSNANCLLRTLEILYKIAHELCLQNRHGYAVTSSIRAFHRAASFPIQIGFGTLLKASSMPEIQRIPPDKPPDLRVILCKGGRAVLSSTTTHSSLFDITFARLSKASISCIPVLAAIRRCHEKKVSTVPNMTVDDGNTFIR